MVLIAELLLSHLITWLCVRQRVCVPALVGVMEDVVGVLLEGSPHGKNRSTLELFFCNYPDL